MVNNEDIQIQFRYYTPENYPVEVDAIRPLPARRIQRATHVKVVDVATGNEYNHVTFCSMSDVFKRSIGRKIALQGVIPKTPAHIRPLVWPSYVERLQADVKRGQIQAAELLLEE